MIGAERWEFRSWSAKVRHKVVIGYLALHSIPLFTCSEQGTGGCEMQSLPLPIPFSCVPGWTFL